MSIGVTKEGELWTQPGLKLAAGHRVPELDLASPKRCGYVEAHLVQHPVRVCAREPPPFVGKGVTEEQAAGRAHDLHVAVRQGRAGPEVFRSVNGRGAVWAVKDQVNPWRIIIGGLELQPAVARCGIKSHHLSLIPAWGCLAPPGCGRPEDHGAAPVGTRDVEEQVNPARHGCHGHTITRFPVPREGDADGGRVEGRDVKRSVPSGAPEAHQRASRLGPPCRRTRPVRRPSARVRCRGGP